MDGSLKLNLYLIFLILPFADPGIAHLTTVAHLATNDFESTTEFILDTDYRDYNITEDVGVLKAYEKPDDVHMHMTEQLCIQTSIQNGNEIMPLFLAIQIVITDNDTILKPLIVSIAANHCNNTNGCDRILTSDTAGEDVWESVGNFCYDFSLGMLMLSLSFLMAVKIWKGLLELYGFGSSSMMESELRDRGYIVLPPPTFPLPGGLDPWE